MAHKRGWALRVRVTRHVEEVGEELGFVEWEEFG